MLRIFITSILTAIATIAYAVPLYEVTDISEVTAIMAVPASGVPEVGEAAIDTTSLAPLRQLGAKPGRIPLYALPYSRYTKSPDWPHLWVNTGIFAGAFVGTLFVLQCLPEDATTWNRASLQRPAPDWRWFHNIFKRGPEWDHDNPIFNFVLHPYAGAVYFMSARGCGFNFYQSLLYSALISTVGWEFGIEACMERPSYQDIFITPLVGSVIGELFYKLKRHIVSRGYRLFGSPVLGNVVAFIIDPVNEVVGYFGRSDTRHMRSYGKTPAVSSCLVPSVGQGSFGFTLSCIF